MYNQVIKCKAAALFIAIYMYYFRYGIHVSRLADPKLTASKHYGIMTPLSDNLRAICSDQFLIDLYYNSD